MNRLFGKPLVTQEDMRSRIRELGREITHDYQERDLVLIGILKGAFTFIADLTRAIRLPIHVDFMMVKTVKAKRRKTGTVKVISELSEEIQNRDVLIVEDIVDSGRTIELLMKRVAKHKPSSLEVCALLNKPAGRVVPVRVKYVGFDIPDHYVVGYGMDYQQKFRNLPYLAVMDSSDFPHRED